jgi:tetrahydromethanopterin S-methyltransferase subunit G
MYKMRESWTDERLDDFRDEVNRRFDGVDRRFDKVDAELHRLNDRLDGLHRTLLQIAGGTIATLIAGFAGLIATQL